MSPCRPSALQSGRPPLRDAASRSQHIAPRCDCAFLKAAGHERLQGVDSTHWRNWRERPQPAARYSNQSFREAGITSGAPGLALMHACSESSDARASRERREDSAVPVLVIRAYPQVHNRGSRPCCIQSCIQGLGQSAVLCGCTEERIAIFRASSSYLSWIHHRQIPRDHLNP